MPYENGETNTGDRMQMYGFTISTEYHSNGNVGLDFVQKKRLL